MDYRKPAEDAAAGRDMGVGHVAGVKLVDTHDIFTDSGFTNSYAKAV